MSYNAHQEFIRTTWNLYFRIYLFIAPRRSQNTKINSVAFVTGLEPTYGACSDLDLWDIGEVISETFQRQLDHSPAKIC